MRKKLLSILQIIIFLGGGIFLAWWQLKSMTLAEREEFVAALRSVNYWIVIPVFFMGIISHISRSLRWKILMEPLGFTPKLKNVFCVTMIGYLVNAAIPRMGEIVKCTFLAKYEKLKIDKLVGTIIVERSFDLVCYVIFIGITILIQLEVVKEFFINKILPSISEGKKNWTSKLLFFIGILVFSWFLVKFLLKKYKENKIIQQINATKNGIIEGLKAVQKIKNRKSFFLHTIIIWSMYLLQIYVGFWGMTGTAELSIQASFSVLALATLAMIITPGGIGSFPIFIMQVLLIYHIDSPVGRAFGWMMWGITSIQSVALGIISLVAIPYLNPSKNESERIF